MNTARYWRDVRDDCDYEALSRVLHRRRRRPVNLTSDFELDRLMREADAELLRVALPPVLRSIPPPVKGSIAMAMAWAPLKA